MSATAKASPKQVKAMTKKQLVVNKKLAPKGGAKKKVLIYVHTHVLKKNVYFKMEHST